ncbi:MAG: hypothetical protein LPH21_13340 [Shewanella sp.]|nr:hypothetical protein [Shewanella sp.]
MNLNNEVSKRAFVDILSQRSGLKPGTIALIIDRNRGDSKATVKEAMGLSKRIREVIEENTLASE